MKKLMIALCLTCTSLANAVWVPDPIDEEFVKMWWGTKDEQVLACLAKVFLCHKAGNLDAADFYMDVLEALIHDEPLPD